MDNSKQYATNIETNELICKISTIYKLLSNEKLEINLPTVSIELKSNDKLIVAFLLGLIVTDKKIRKILSSSKIDIQMITNSIEYFDDLEEEIKEHEKNNSRDISREYRISEFFFSDSKNISNVDNITYQIYMILYNLMQSNECNNKILDYIFSKLSNSFHLTYATESKFFEKLSKKINNTSKLLILKKFSFNEKTSLIELQSNIYNYEPDTIPIPLAIENSKNYVERESSNEFIDEDVNEKEDTETIEDIIVKKKSFLEENGSILNDKIYLSNPAVGREIELKNLMVTLLTDEKSPIIIGDAGVGKTSLVEGLAYLINEGDVPRNISDKQIIKLNLSTIISGCGYVGNLESRMDKLIKELSNKPDVILFIDEIHNIVGAGATSKNPMDVSNILKPHLDRGSIKIIGATTKLEYEKYFGSDDAFKRRFEPVQVNEASDEMLFSIIDLTIRKLEKKKQIRFLFRENTRKEIIVTLISLTKKKNRNHSDYVNNPDLAISILSKAFAYALLDDSYNVSIDNIIDAINSSNRIVDSVKPKYINTIGKMKENQKLTEHTDNNIVNIKFK